MMRVGVAWALFVGLSVAQGAEVYKCVTDAGVVYSERRCGDEYQSIEVQTVQQKRGGEVVLSPLEQDEADYRQKIGDIDRELSSTRELLGRVRASGTADNGSVTAELEARVNELERQRAAVTRAHLMQLELHLKRSMDARYETARQRQDLERSYRQLRDSLSR